MLLPNFSIPVEYAILSILPFANCSDNVAILLSTSGTKPSNTFSIGNTLEREDHIAVLVNVYNALAPAWSLFGINSIARFLASSCTIKPIEAIPPNSFEFLSSVTASAVTCAGVETAIPSDASPNGDKTILFTSGSPNAVPILETPLPTALNPAPNPLELIIIWAVIPSNPPYIFPLSYP